MFVPIILLTAANSKTDLPQLANEMEGIQKGLKEAVQKGLCEIIERANLKPEDLAELFNNPDYKDRIVVFHYAGHAGDGTIDHLYAEGIATLLRTQRHLQLAFFNACATDRLLPNLQPAQIPALVLTDKLIGDEAAAKFAVHFYKSIGQGNPIEMAFTLAKGLLQSEHNPSQLRDYHRKGQVPSLEPTLPWQLVFNTLSAPNWHLAYAADKPLALLPKLCFKAKKLPKNPSVGLNYYTEIHAPIFFGRDYEIAQLYYKVTDTTHHPLILFCGQSGVGKSSILAAGLLPRLKPLFHQNESTYIRRNQQEGLADVFKTVLGIENTDDLRAKWQAIETDTGKPLLIVIDQLEEIFTSQALPEEQIAFFKDLASLLKPQTGGIGIKGKIILSFRKEYLAELKKRLEEYNIRHQPVKKQVEKCRLRWL